jgi:hypothetical protein
MFVASREPFKSWGSTERGLTPFSEFENVLYDVCAAISDSPRQAGSLTHCGKECSQNRSTLRMATFKHGKFKMACDLNETLQRQFYFFWDIFPRGGVLRCWEGTAKWAKWNL